jgi:hypothetical protein
MLQRPSFWMSADFFVSHMMSVSSDFLAFAVFAVDFIAVVAVRETSAALREELLQKRFAVVAALQRNCNKKLQVKRVGK